MQRLNRRRNWILLFVAATTCAVGIGYWLDRGKSSGPPSSDDARTHHREVAASDRGSSALNAAPSPRSGQSNTSPWSVPVVSTSTWDEFLIRLTQEQRNYLVQTNLRYFDVLSFHSEEEQQELIRAGFPMPEEWLAAQDLSDDALRDLFLNNNDSKAGYFLVDRLLTRLETLEAQLPESPDDQHLIDLVRRSRADVSGYGNRVLETADSPFAAYSHGQARAAELGSMIPIAASMMLASDLGALTNYDAFNRFSMQYPDLPSSLVYQSYVGMRRAMLRNPSLRIQYFNALDRQR